MDERERQRYERRARILKAMAHPTRLFIADELARGRRCVCELTELVGADTSTVSKHLSILKSAGIVSDEKEGLKVYYSLHLSCFLNFLDCMDDIIKTCAVEELSLVSGV